MIPGGYLFKHIALLVPVSEHVFLCSICFHKSYRKLCRINNNLISIANNTPNLLIQHQLILVIVLVLSYHRHDTLCLSLSLFLTVAVLAWIQVSTALRTFVVIHCISPISPGVSAAALSSPVRSPRNFSQHQ